MVNLTIKLETDNPEKNNMGHSFVTFKEEWTWGDSNIEPFKLFEKLVDVVEKEQRGQTTHSTAFDG